MGASLARGLQLKKPLEIVVIMWAYMMDFGGNTIVNADHCQASLFFRLMLLLCVSLDPVSTF
jgi:hypothetical protein